MLNYCKEKIVWYFHVDNLVSVGISSFFALKSAGNSNKQITYILNKQIGRISLHKTTWLRICVIGDTWQNSLLDNGTFLYLYKLRNLSFLWGMYVSVREFFDVVLMYILNTTYCVP